MTVYGCCKHCLFPYDDRKAPHLAACPEGCNNSDRVQPFSSAPAMIQDINPV